MANGFDTFIAQLRMQTKDANLALEACQDSLIAAETVLERASARYFSLVARTQASLKGRFSLQEWGYLANTERTLIWDWRAGMRVATMVADTYGVDCLDAPELDGALRILLYKLLQLSPVENAAVVDACEQVWRGCRNPLLEDASEAGAGGRGG